MTPLKASPKLLAFKAGFPQQAAFVADKSRFVFAGASVRSGKTYAAARKFLTRVFQDIRKMPNTLKTYWVIAPTSEENIACKIELASLLPDRAIDHARQRNDGKWRDLKHGHGKLWLTGNVLIEFKTADRPEGLVARKVYGVWWTEIARSKHLAWPNVRSRLANTQGWLIADTSPYGRCWFFLELWEPATRKAMPNVGAHIWRAVDSPYIPRDEIEQARAMLPPAMFRREFEADWSTFQGLIYDEFDKAVHLKTCPFAPDKAYIGVDVNVASEMPAAYCVIYASGLGRNRRLHVEREFYRRGIGIDGLGGYIETIMQDYRSLAQLRPTIVIDPSAAYVKSKLMEAGADVWGGDNAVVEGIQRVMMMLHPIAGVPRMTIDPRCTNLVNELSGYRWKVNSDGVLREEPEKIDDHLLDACRYVVMNAIPPWESSFKQLR